MKEIIIKVSGMMCGGCENRIKNALSSINGVDCVEANHESGVVKVIAKEELSKKVLEETIDDIGFEVAKED